MIKNRLILVKAHIKGLAAEGQRTRKYIDRSVKEKRDSFWRLKREIGVDARNYLLAYGLLRNVPYSLMERRCREDNKPNVEIVTRIILAALGPYRAREWSQERVRGLLTRPEDAGVDTLKEAV